jgi:cysteine synthase B
MEIKTIDSLIGNTPLVKLQRLNKNDNQILVKLEGDNPAGSVKDRAAMYMISGAENAGLS